MVFVELDRHVATRVWPGAVDRVVLAGDTLIATPPEVLYVLRVLVLLPRGQRPVSAREDQIPDAHVAVQVKIERPGFEAVVLRAKALNGARRQVRIFVPCAEGGLALKAVRERGAPLIVENPLQCQPATLDVRPVVIVARPR